MSDSCLLVAVAAWAIAAGLAAAGFPRWGRALLCIGCAAGLVGAAASLPGPTPTVVLPTHLAGLPVEFTIAPGARWLLGFGLLGALVACLLGSPGGRRLWVSGAACSLLGALGVFGLQDGASFLVAWELMSLGGALLLIGDGAEDAPGRPIMLMLTLLEVGAVALLLAILLLSRSSGDLAFGHLAAAAAGRGSAVSILGGLLLLAGAGAKLGLLPFYEWFPVAYGTGSGASGALLSGVVLNAAFAFLGHGLLAWCATAGSAGFILGVVVTLVGTASAILAILYAFQQDDWRRLLSLSSAENASIAVTMLGAAILFRAEQHPELSGLAWTVALIHLAGHALTKAAMFLAADGIAVASGSYDIRHGGLARSSSWTLSVGAVLAGMSLAAMPPTIGFASEWFAFQTVFQGFRLPDLGARFTLALAGAGLALTAALALATFIKALGLGLFGGAQRDARPVSRRTSAGVFVLGAAGLVASAGMPLWLAALGTATLSLHDGALLVPLTAKFAFISPTLLAIVMPLLAIVPIGLVLISRRGRPARPTEVWYGGSPQAGRPVATTALTFSNAMRTFYGLIYRPTATLERRGGDEKGYFVRTLHYHQRVRPIFEPTVFRHVAAWCTYLSDMVRGFQSGDLNLYLAVIGVLLSIVLLVGLTV